MASQPATQSDAPDVFTDPIHDPFSRRGLLGSALLLHGFPGTPAETRYVRKTLTSLDVGTTGIQLPGMGRDIAGLAGLQPNAWLEAAQGAWQDLHQQANDKPTFLVGYSMGGALSIQLAATSQPTCLVLLSPFWRFGDALAHYLIPVIQYVKPTVSAFETTSLDDPSFRETILEMSPDLDLDDPDVVASLKEQMVLPTRVINYVRRTGLRAYRAAPQVNCPVLIIQAASDSVVLPKMTDRLVRRFRNASSVEYIKVEGEHSFPKSEGKFQELIKQFVEQYI